MDYAVISAQVHEREQTQQSVVVGVKVSVVIRFVAGIPQPVHKLPSYHACRHQRRGRRCGYKPERMAQAAVASCIKHILHFRTVHVVLVHKIVDSAAVQEPLQAVGIAALPLPVAHAHE